MKRNNLYAIMLFLCEQKRIWDIEEDLSHKWSNRVRDAGRGRGGCLTEIKSRIFRNLEAFLMKSQTLTEIVLSRELRELSPGLPHAISWLAQRLWMNTTWVDAELEMGRFSATLSLFSELKFNDSAPNWREWEQSRAVQEQLKWLPALTSANLGSHRPLPRFSRFS